MLFDFLKQKKTGGKDFLKAISNGDIQELRRLLDRGAEIDWQSNVGISGLMQALIYNQFKLADFMVDRGCDLNLSDQDGYTALIYIINANLLDKQQAEVLSLMEKMIAKGANIHAADKSGASAIHHAVSRLYPSAVERLIVNGADVDMQNSSGVTPLMMTIQSGDPNKCHEIAATLLGYGADINLRTSGGKSVIDLVIEYGRHDILQIIENHSEQRVLNELIAMPEAQIVSPKF